MSAVTAREGKGPDSDATTPLVVHTTGRGWWNRDDAQAGTLRGDAGGMEAGDHLVAYQQPFIVNAAESCAAASHAREAETARALDTAGGFAAAQGGTVVVFQAGAGSRALVPDVVAPALKGGGSHSPHPPAVAFTVYPEGGQGSDLAASPCDVASALSRTALGASTDRGTRIVQAFVKRHRANDDDDPETWGASEIAPTLNAHDEAGGEGRTACLVASSPRFLVRRLMPIECERLQGFPDGWTEIPWVGRGRNAPDTLRYAALGNAVAVPVVERIARWLDGALADFTGARAREIAREQGATVDEETP